MVRHSTIHLQCLDSEVVTITISFSVRVLPLSCCQLLQFLGFDYHSLMAALRTIRRHFCPIIKAEKHTLNTLNHVTRLMSSLNMEPVDFRDYQHHRQWMEQESRKRMPEYFNFAHDVIDVWAAREGTYRSTSLPALWLMDEKGRSRKWSFQNISTISKKISNMFLHKCNLTQGDAVLIVLPRVPEWWFCSLATIRSGLVSSPGTILLRSKDFRHRLVASGAKCIIADKHTVDEIDKVSSECPELKWKIFVGKRKETRPGWINLDDAMERASDNFQNVATRFNDPMTVFFTSGTTGAPKMAEHTHGSYGYGHIITARYFLQCNQTSTVWNMSDTGWAKCAWSSFFAPWLVGSCIFAHTVQKFDPELTLKVVAENREINVLCTPPTALRFFVQLPLKDYKLHGLRCLGAGEPVNPELLEKWRDGTGLELFEGYGQTETTFVCGTFPAMEIKAGSMGLPAPGIDLQILNEDGHVVDRNTEGEIGINCNNFRPIGLFNRYVDDDERTKSSFRAGYYLTGDRAKMDDDGYVWFVGRNDDVIITSGYRIGPFEVESALIEHPGVLESAVVSSPDDVRGEIVKAFVILTQKYRNKNKELLTVELQDFVKDNTAPYKYPRKIEFVDELPKTISGKIRRVELRQKEWGH